MGNGIDKMSTKQHKIKLVKANKKDSRDIYSWRNDKDTRMSSFNPGVISYKAHKDWFNASLKNLNRYMYIGKDNQGNKIGAVRIDRIDRYAGEFDININPSLRGMGYGAQMIAEACRKFIFENSHRLNQFIFIARVKNNNPASLKVFKKAGFLKIFDYINEKGFKTIVLVKFFEKKD